MNIIPARSGYVRPILGMPACPIMVVCDPQNDEALSQRAPLSKRQLQYFFESLEKAGLLPGMFQFVSLCPPIPEEAASSVKRTWEFVEPYLSGLHELIADRTPRVLVTVGNLATRAVLGKPAAITKVRGICQELEPGRLLFPILSPGYVLRVPEQAPVFRSDLVTLRKIIDGGFNPDAVRSTGTNYEWCFDLSSLLKTRPKFLAVDTEGTGLHWYKPEVRVITVQLTPEPGRTLICPINAEYRRRWFNDTGGMRATAGLRAQLRELMADPDIGKVAHNLKFDHHLLRKENMEVTGWVHDTQLLAFAVDENMVQKNLADCTKRWLPDMAGYSDTFDKLVDKNNMMDVPPEDVLDEAGNLVRPGMRSYAGGDPDATFRLGKVLVPLLRQDKAQYNCYRRVILPGILAFAQVMEVHGQRIDRAALRQLEMRVDQFLATEYDRLIKLVPAAVRRRTLEAGKECKFSRDEFMRDVLFSKDGFRLKPKVYTDSTAHYEKMAKQARTPEERAEYLSRLQPSVSTKQHMPYFKDAPGKAGEFVNGYIAFIQATKIKTTYIGEEAKGTGFWKYLGPNGELHPSYRLDNTNTGRTSSQDPNGQNIPKRGDFAKLYRACYMSNPGYSRIDCDLSQIELRLVAWMANEQEMLRVYRSGGDIHTETAMATSRMDAEAWAALSKDEKKLRRFKAKAVNFGFVYGMQWRGFKVYAKTQYDVEYTDEEAQDARNLYFRKYPGLLPWHTRMKEDAHRNGFVRGLHGALRRLPSIWSNDETVQSLAERQAVNAPIQRFGSDLGVIAASILARHADPDIVRPVGFIHDCLACEARIGHEDEAAAAITWIMGNIPLERYFGITAPLPILADAEVEYRGPDILNDQGKVIVSTGEMVERVSEISGYTREGQQIILPKIEPTVPWFWRDEVEETFEAFMTKVGCPAHAPYVSPHAVQPVAAFGA